MNFARVRWRGLFLSTSDHAAGRRLPAYVVCYFGGGGR
jgi:hypothetical protein